MLSFHELRNVITKCCTSQKAVSFEEKHHFEIDFDKLEVELGKAQSDLHVMSFDHKMESVVPAVTDLQLITEYSRKPKDIETMLDGKSQFIQFFIYCDKDGSIQLANEAGEPLDPDYQYNAINGFYNELDMNVISCILKQYPYYRVLVMKSFDDKKEKFNYSVWIRASYEMITYLKENGIAISK